MEFDERVVDELGIEELETQRHGEHRGRKSCQASGAYCRNGPKSALHKRLPTPWTCHAAAARPDSVVPSSAKSGIGERKAVPVNDLPVTQEGKSFREDSHAFKEGWYHPCQQW